MYKHLHSKSAKCCEFGLGTWVNKSGKQQFDLGQWRQSYEQIFIVETATNLRVAVLLEKFSLNFIIMPFSLTLEKRAYR